MAKLPYMPIPFGETSEFVLASRSPPSVFNFYPSMENARLDADRANGLVCDCGHRFTDAEPLQIVNETAFRVCACGERAWPCGFGLTTAHDVYEPMTWQDFEIARRGCYLGGPAARITAEKWHEMLDILPPLFWEQSNDLNSFLMSEFYSGSYTHQYVRRGRGESATYWTKMVDARDRSTWMTYESLTAIAEVAA